MKIELGPHELERMREFAEAEKEWLDSIAFESSETVEDMVGRENEMHDAAITLARLFTARAMLAGVVL